MAIWSSRTNKKSRTTNKTSATSNPYHCVELKMPYNACEAVLKLHGKRFLSAQAPQVPLPECDQACRCTFKHHDDRRVEERRDAFSPGGIHYDGEKNRRVGIDRRRNKRTQTHVSIG